MVIIVNKDIYKQAKNIADNTYKKNSAYKSGYIQKLYKNMGGQYIDDNKEKKLSRWFREDWSDIGDLKYPVYRPSKKISVNTPLLISEIDKDNLKKQIKLKQKYKGEKNLPSFKPK